MVGRETAAGARIAETLAFFEFIQTELPEMLERWRAREGRAVILERQAVLSGDAFEEGTRGGCEMSQLDIKAFAGILQLFVVLALTIFLPAWTLDYWQAWIVVAVFFGCTIAVTLYLMKNDPKLLERRVSAGVVAEQREESEDHPGVRRGGIHCAVCSLCTGSSFRVVHGAAYLVAMGDVLIVVGFYLVFRVFKENSFELPGRSKSVPSSA